jgi:hypothetical protein
VSVQVAPVAHEIEQEDGHVIAHVDPATQDTLPLWPTVAVQVAFAPHSTLHDLPHVPLQVAEDEQRSEQLSAPSHDPKLQAEPVGQLQDAPVQVALVSAGLVLSLPQATPSTKNASAGMRSFVRGNLT